MSFRIWAVGLTGVGSGGREPFRYAKEDCLDQGDFEPPALLSLIPASPDAGGVAKTAVGTPESHVGDATVQGMYKVAELVFAHQVITGINLLAMHGRGGEVSVYCRENKWYWADSNSFVEYKFYTSTGNPGREFLKKIGPGLKKNSLNNFGVLAEISKCLMKYDSKLPSSAEAHLRIELRH
ncbi:MAG: hypothetical protein ACOC71_03690 [Hyphomicrobiales bacterium]